MNYNSHAFLRLLADAAGKETLSRFRKAPAVDNKLSAGFDGTIIIVCYGVSGFFQCLDEEAAHIVVVFRQ